MTEKQNNEGWVYVVVCDPDKDETFLGLYDKEKGVQYIPVFDNKDAANECFLTLPREKGRKYEIQAIHLDELKEDASENDFIIAMVDKEGNVIK